MEKIISNEDISSISPSTHWSDRSNSLTINHNVKSYCDNSTQTLIPFYRNSVMNCPYCIQQNYIPIPYIYCIKCAKII